MNMIKLQEGQCGLCKHFGENDGANPKLVQIRTTKMAPETFVEECGHPKLEPLHLSVTPASGCKGFEPAIAA